MPVLPTVGKLGDKASFPIVLLKKWIKRLATLPTVGKTYES
jgi:hypothetical protein